MFLGAGVVMAMVTLAILLAAPYAQHGAMWTGAVAAAEVVGWPTLAGVATLIAGRAIYGRWRMGAPVASFTGSIARTAGLASAAVLGGSLLFMLATGIKQEDTPAAVALSLGALLGVMVAQVGSSLRGRGFPD